MSRPDMKRAVLNLKMIAASAEKLADDIGNGRLWPGEYRQQLGSMAQAFHDLPNDDGQGHV